MPKLKPSPLEESKRVVRSCMDSNMALYEISEDHIAAKINCTKRTIQNRRERPENFTLEELWTVARTLKWTPIQAASVVLGRPITSKELKEFLLL